MYINITVKGGVEFVRYLDNVSKKLPEASNRDIRNISYMYSRELIKSARMAGIKDYTGRLSSTRPVRNVPGDYTIGIPQYAEFLDSMKPHYVWGYKHPWFADWAALRTGESGRWYPGIERGAFKVKPHPFIKAAIKNANSQVIDMIRNGEVIKTIKGKR
jgi:hypothetical protein